MIRKRVTNKDDSEERNRKKTKEQRNKEKEEQGKRGSVKEDQNASSRVMYRRYKEDVIPLTNRIPEFIKSTC